MAESTLREDLAHASTQLAHWRLDGCADRIVFWRERLDELLDRLNEQPTEPKPAG